MHMTLSETSRKILTGTSCHLGQSPNLFWRFPWPEKRDMARLRHSEQKNDLIQSNVLPSRHFLQFALVQIAPPLNPFHSNLLVTRTLSDYDIGFRDGCGNINQSDYRPYIVDNYLVVIHCVYNYRVQVTVKSELTKTKTKTKCGGGGGGMLCSKLHHLVVFLEEVLDGCLASVSFDVPVRQLQM